MASFLYKLGVAAIGTTIGSSIAGWTFDRWNSNHKIIDPPSRLPIHRSHLISRAMQIQYLQSESEFDVQTIEDGYTCGLDTVTRDLKTTLVERDDFSSGTSSKSMKLMEGDVQTLQKTVTESDCKQCSIINEVLREKANLLESAPHLVHLLPIMLPVYKWWQIPSYSMGIERYDLAIGDCNIKGSYFLSKQDALELFPMLKKEKLVGAIMYYDGKQGDGRICLAVILTGPRSSTAVCNHVEGLKLLRIAAGNGRHFLYGIEVINRMTGKKFIIKAKCLVNATNSFTGPIRQMGDHTIKSICAPLSGAHVKLPGYYSPEQISLIDPAICDDRIIYFLPWQMHTITTSEDTSKEVKDKSVPSVPSNNGTPFILNEAQEHLNEDVRVKYSEMLSDTSGTHDPAVSYAKKDDTESNCRTVHISPSNLITVANDKGITSNGMVKHAEDIKIEVCDLKPEWAKSVSSSLKNESDQNLSPTVCIRLVQDYGLDYEVAEHLAKLYGDRAFEVAKMASLTGKRWPIAGNRIHPDFPCIDAEVRYGVRENAYNIVDMIAHHLRLSFLNVQATHESLPKICDIMAEELSWTNKEKKKQIIKAKQFLALKLDQAVKRHRTNLDLTKEEQDQMSPNHIRKTFKQRFGNGDASSEQFDDILLKDIDTNIASREKYLEIEKLC